MTLAMTSMNYDTVIVDTPCIIFFNQEVLPPANQNKTNNDVIDVNKKSHGRWEQLIATLGNHTISM